MSVDTREHGGQKVVASGWWRAARYQIRAGAVEPVPGAAVERYDVWAQRKVKTDGRAYVALANIDVERSRPFLDAVRAAGGAPNLDRATSDAAMFAAQRAEALALDFCNAWGSPGTLPHRILEMSATVQDAGVSSSVAHDFPNPFKPSRPLVAVATSTPSGWCHVIRAAGDVETSPSLTLLRDIDVLGVTEVEGPDAARLLARHLVEGNVPTPLVGSTAFWGRYREPVASILNAASSFSAAMGVMLRSDGEWFDDVADRARQTLEALAARASSTIVAEVNPRLGRPRRGAPRTVLRPARRWCAPSLIAHLAQLMIDDFADGVRARRCVDCDRWLVSTRLDAIYCSDKCRFRVLKRRQRNRGGPT